MCTLFLFCYSCPVCYSLNLNYIPLVSGICLVLSENTSFLCTCYSLSLCLSYIIQLFFKITFFFVTHKFSIFSACHSVTRNCTASFTYSVTFFFLIPCSFSFALFYFYFRFFLLTYHFNLFFFNFCLSLLLIL